MQKSKFILFFLLIVFLNIGIVSAETEQDSYFWFYSVIIGIGFALLVLGYKNKDYILTLFSGMLILAFGITFVNTGYLNLTNLYIIRFIILSSFGLGSYIMLNSALNIMKEWL